MSEAKLLSKKLIGDVWDVTVVDKDGVKHEMKIDGCKISREEKSWVFKEPDEVERDAIEAVLSSTGAGGDAR